MNIGGESKKLEDERNSKKAQFQDELMKQVEDKKRKKEAEKKAEEEKDRLAEQRLQKQIQDELTIDNDPKKHRKKKLTDNSVNNPNINNKGSDDIQILVKEPKKHINPPVKQESLNKQESFHEIKELPDQENMSNPYISNFEQIQAMQTLQAQQMMNQLNTYQNNPNNAANQHNYTMELEHMQRELRRQREEMEETIGALRRQTNSVQQDSAKHQNEMSQLKMQIDLSKEKEMLIKQMYDVNMNNMRNEIESYKEKLEKLEQDNEKRKQEKNTNNNQNANRFNSNMNGANN